MEVPTDEVHRCGDEGDDEKVARKCGKGSFFRPPTPQLKKTKDRKGEYAGKL
jgi:hypothetical protein